MKTLYLSLLITFLWSNSLFSQFRNGYIIKNDNDTIYGFIDFEGSIQNSDHCKFKTLPDSPAEIYYPGDIKAFRFLGSKYFSTSEIKINNKIKKVFLEWLIKGRASILTYSSNNMNPRYFILPERDSLYELQNSINIFERMDKGVMTTYQTTKKEYVGTLLYYLKDCPSISHDIESTDLSSKPLIKIAKEYHEITCKNEECIVFEDKSRKLKYESGFSLGFLNSQLRINTDVPERVYLSQSVGFGVALNISNLPLVSPKFDFGTQIMYYDVLYSYNLEEGLHWGTTENRIYHIKYLRIPWQLNYRFSYDKLTTFVSLGLTTNMRLDYTGYNQYLLNYVTSHYNYNLGLSLCQVGINSGIGLKYQISRRVSINMKFDYERGIRFFGTYPKDHSFLNNFIAQSSIMFKMN